MTTLILLCLALVGAGILLLVPQARAQIVGGLSLKFLCLVMIGCMVLPTAQVRAESSLELIASCISMYEETRNPVESYYKEWQKLRCTSVLLEAQDTGEYDRVRSKLCMEWWDNPEDGALNDLLIRDCKKRTAADIVGVVEEWATRAIRMPEKAEEALRGFKKSVDALWVALKEDKRYCDVLLNGTVLLREIEEHNERGLGVAVAGARFSDGKLRGILEVAKQGCKPE